MIYKSKIQRILELQRENERLRALVGQAAPVEGEDAAPAQTLVEKTDGLEEAVGLLAEVIL
jgi:phage host-nuclease inhibitor protein Gam